MTYSYCSHAAYCSHVRWGSHGVHSEDRWDQHARYLSFWIGWSSSHVPSFPHAGCGLDFHTHDEHHVDSVAFGPSFAYSGCGPRFLHPSHLGRSQASCRLPLPLHRQRPSLQLPLPRHLPKPMRGENKPRMGMRNYRGLKRVKHET